MSTKKETISNSNERITEILRGNPYLYVSELRRLNSNKYYLNERERVNKYFNRIRAISLVAKLYYPHQFTTYVKAISEYLWSIEVQDDFERDLYELKSKASYLINDLKEEKNGISFYRNLKTDSISDYVELQMNYISYIDKVIQHINITSWNEDEYLLIDLTEYVDEDLLGINLELMIHEINMKAQINYAIAALFHLKVIGKVNYYGGHNFKSYKDYTLKISKWFKGARPKSIEYLINLYHKTESGMNLSENEKEDNKMYYESLDFINNLKSREKVAR